MEKTFDTKAIIIDKNRFKETDSRVSVFSIDKGRMNLAARGTSKLTSKLSSHLEPLSISKIMVVRGRFYDYAGSAKGLSFYPKTKSDLDKMMLSGRALKMVLDFTREGEEGDFAGQFFMLKNFLDAVEAEDEIPEKREFSFLAYKFLYGLGFLPEPADISSDLETKRFLKELLDGGNPNLSERPSVSSVAKRAKQDIKSFFSRDPELAPLAK